MSKKGKSKTRSIIIQLLISMPVLTVLFALGAAKLILSELLPQEKMQLYACIYAAIIAFAISIYASLRMPQKKVVWGIITTVTYLCMLLLGNLLFFGIGYGHILPVAASVMIAGLIGSLFGAGKRKRYA